MEEKQVCRWLSIASFILGATVGAKLCKSRVGVPGTLLTAAGIKVCILIATVFWRKEDDEDKNLRLDNVAQRGRGQV